MRAFVSIDLDGLEEAIQQAQEPFTDLPGVRTVRPDQAHLTLKFLGDIDDDRVPEIRDAMSTAIDRADTDPFQLEVRGYGVFPSEEYISVVWLGCGDGSGQVRDIQAAIETELVDRGFDPEDNVFTPHITVARVDDGRSKAELQDIIRTHEPDVGRVSVEEVRLKESELGPDGPEYRTVESFQI